MHPSPIEIQSKNLREAFGWWLFSEYYTWSDLRRRAALSLDPSKVIGWHKHPFGSGGALLLQSDGLIDDFRLSHISERLAPIESIAMRPRSPFWRDALHYLRYSPSVAYLVSFGFWISLWIALPAHTLFVHNTRSFFVSLAFTLLFPLLQIAVCSFSYWRGRKKLLNSRERAGLKLEFMIYFAGSVFMLCGLCNFWAHPLVSILHSHGYLLKY